MKYWTAVYCRYGQEFTAEENLRRQGFNARCPRAGAKPKLPTYILLEVDTETNDYGKIRSTKGCIRRLSGQMPLEAALSLLYGDSLEKLPFGVGDKVRINTGLLEHYTGLVQAITGQASEYQASLLIGNMMATMPIQCVEKV